MKEVRVMVAMPCHGMVTPETTLSLGMMMLRIGLEPPEGLTWVAIKRYSSSNLSHSRAYLAESAKKEHDATHVLWVDADMEFPQYSLHKLLARNQDVVGCNYTRRAPPYTPSSMDMCHRLMYTADESVGLVEVGTIGFGLLLTDLRVFEKLSLPWFSQWDQGAYCTEDVPWCRKIREEGKHQIWVDQDLSKQIRHIGNVGFTYKDAVGA